MNPRNDATGHSWSQNNLSIAGASLTGAGTAVPLVQDRTYDRQQSYRQLLTERIAWHHRQAQIFESLLRALPGEISADANQALVELLSL